jgi:hypothetical protein
MITGIIFVVCPRWDFTESSENQDFLGEMDTQENAVVKSKMQ